MPLTRLGVVLGRRFVVPSKPRDPAFLRSPSGQQRHVCLLAAANKSAGPSQEYFTLSRFRPRRSRSEPRPPCFWRSPPEDLAAGMAQALELTRPYRSGEGMPSRFRVLERDGMRTSGLSPRRFRDPPAMRIPYDSATPSLLTDIDPSLGRPPAMVTFPPDRHRMPRCVY